MPTGHTDALEKMGWDLAKWLKTNIVRAMGVCVALREARMDLSESQIIEELNKAYKNNWHTEQLKVAKAEIAKLKKKTDGQWVADYEALCKDLSNRYMAACGEQRVRAAAYNATLGDLRRIQTKARSEVAVGTIRFAIEQLVMVRDEFQPPDKRHYEPPASWQKYRDERFLAVKKDIEYHTKEAAAEDEREGDRASAYKEFVKEVDALIG